MTNLSVAEVAQDLAFSPEEIQQMLDNLDQFSPEEVAEIDKLVDELSTRARNTEARDDLIEFCCDEDDTTEWCWFEAPGEIRFPCDTVTKGTSGTEGECNDAFEELEDYCLQ